MCITSQTVAYDISAVEQSAYGIADVRGFWSTLPTEVEIKTTREVV